MAETHVVLICVTVGALALAAAVLGIIGEATKSRSFVRYDGVNCVYRRTPAFDCGVAAAASLLTGQVILTAATGCWDGCRRRSYSSDHRRAGAVFAAVLSWFLAILSASAFLVGALRTESGERRPKEGVGVASYYQCTVLVAGVFAGASFCSLLAAVAGITSYVASETAASELCATDTTAAVAGEARPEGYCRDGPAAVTPSSSWMIGCPTDCPTSTSGESTKVRTFKELLEGDRGENYDLCD